MVLKFDGWKEETVNTMGIYKEWKEDRKSFSDVEKVDLIWKSFPAYYLETILATLQGENDWRLHGMTVREAKNLARRIKESGLIDYDLK